MLLHVTRESVHAADEPQPWDLELADDATVLDLTKRFIGAWGMASIVGGNASWVIQADPAADRRGDPLALVAQQWDHEAYVVVDPGMPLLGSSASAGIFVAYAAQIDPWVLQAWFTDHPTEAAAWRTAFDR